MLKNNFCLQYIMLIIAGFSKTSYTYTRCLHDKKRNSKKHIYVTFQTQEV